MGLPLISLMRSSAAGSLSVGLSLFISSGDFGVLISTLIF